MTTSEPIDWVDLDLEATRDELLRSQWPVVLVGGSLRLQCGVEPGAHCVLVATGLAGLQSLDALRAAQPTSTFDGPTIGRDGARVIVVRQGSRPVASCDLAEGLSLVATGSILIPPCVEDSVWLRWRRGKEPDSIEPGTLPDTLADVAAARRAAPTPTIATVEDPQQIVCGPDEERVNNEGVAALARHPGVYQRGGALVHVVADQSPLRGVIRPRSAPRIIPMAPPTLRECLAACAVWAQQSEKGLRRVAVPKNSVAAIHARGQWQGVRTLEAVTDCPVLRPDGSVIEEPGYDPATGILFVPSIPFARVPERPTLDDAKAALAKVFDLFVDFPFRAEAHRSAAVAAVLTPLASYAFRGAKPLFLFDANTAGAGKGKCVSIVSEIVQGRPMAVMAPTEDEEEQRKRILAIAISGEALTLIDNIDGSLGGASMDAAITGQEVSDRILGSTAMVRMPLVTTWFATGNNVALRGDMQRRVVHVRLESPEAHPEDRRDFKHADVEGAARDQRAELVVACLTALRAFRLARPRVDLKPWGSFAGWSDLVRGTLVWCGYADPGETRVELREEADVTTTALVGLLTGWQQATAKHGGYATSGQLLRVLELDEKDAGTTRALGHQGLREALSELCAAPAGKLPSARLVGNLFRRYKGRVVRCPDGIARSLVLARQGNEGAVWHVRRSDSRDSRDSSPPLYAQGEQDRRDIRGETDSRESQESLDPVTAALVGFRGRAIDVC